VPGAIALIDTKTALTETETTVLTTPVGGSGSATFLLDVTAVTGEWTVQPQWRPFGGVGNDAVASLATITSTGVVRVPLTSGHNTTRTNIPFPTHVVWTETMAGSITARLYHARSD